MNERFSSVSEASVSEILENLLDLFPRVGYER